MKEQKAEKILLIGIGNSARQDDGLGWAFLEKVESEGIFKGDVQYKFQLNIEDAELISQYDTVIFVDASKNELEAGFTYNPCFPSSNSEYSTHLLAPESALYVCQQLYRQQPHAWVLAIQGYEWELKEGLTNKALVNLEEAFAWFKNFKIDKPILSTIGEI
ncbi:hydrogenase maturation protease [Pontibacter sp. CAU 1760]